VSNPLRSIVRARLKDKQDQLQGTPGQLGDSSGTVSVPGRPGYVYVRLNNSTQVVEAYNSYAPLLRDLRVHVGYDPRQPQVLQVVQIRPYLQTNHATPGIVQNHHTSHEWMSPTPGGNDVVYSQLRQLMPLRVSPAGGLSIQVYRGVVWTGTGYVPITTTTLDLTSYVPTTLSKQCLVLITVSTSGTLVATKLAEQDWGTLDAPVSSDIPSDTAWVLGAVRLYNGQLAVEEARTGTDILDLRWPMWSPLTSGMTNPMTAAGDLILGGTAGVPGKLAKGADAAVLTIDSTTHLPAWETSAGGGGQTRKLLYDNTLSTAGGWDVSSIDQTYDHLEIKIVARSTKSSEYDDMVITFNNDATDADYLTMIHYFGTGHNGSTGIGRDIGGVLPGNSSVSNEFATFEGAIEFYANTSFDKYLRWRSSHRRNSSDRYDLMGSEEWVSTAAINRIAIASVADTFAIGSRLQIIGVKDSSSGGGGGSGGHVIENNGTAMTSRANLNFIGATVEDDATNNATKVTITGGGSQSDLGRIAHGMFLTAAHTNATPNKCYTMASIDGVSWQTFGSSPAIADALRDPAILHWDSKWWIAATEEATFWYLYSSSDLNTWSTAIQVSTNGVSPTATWAPHWFVDNDGSVHIFVGLEVGGYHQVYEMHPTDRAMTAWSTPVAVSGTGWPTNAIDPCVVHVGDTYYMFVKDDGSGYICLASSTSLTSGWTVTKTGDWASWKSGLSGSIEGPTIIQMDNGKWRLYFTNNNGYSAINIYYSETIDSTFATGWSSAVSLSTLSGYNHPVPMRALGALDLQDQILALIGAAGGIAHLNADGYVPSDQLGSGTPSGSKFLRDDSTWQTVTGGTTDTEAVHLDAADEISTLTEKTTPASTDLLIIEDSDASGVKKKVQIANLPSSSGSGDVTGPTNAIQGHLAVFADTTGKVIADGGAVPSGGGAFADEATRTIPTTNTFSVIHSGNGGVGTISDLSNGLGVRVASTIPSGNYNSWTYGVAAVTVGTNGWQCTARLRRHVPLWAWGMFGMIMRDSASGKSVTYALGNDSVIGFNRNQNSTDDAWAGVATMNVPWQSLNWWMRIKDDKTNWMMYLSMDGNFWTEVYREARNGYLGTVPTHVGIAINPNFNGGTGASFRTGTPVAMDCFSFLFEQL
jgi:hypothetical protein